MTVSPTNHWKLGLFIVATLGAMLGTLFWIGANHLSQETVPFVTFFDESVEGLDKGSSVKMRGVTVGSIAHITFGDDRRLVKVIANLYTEELVRIGLGTPNELLSSEYKLPPGLHAQLASSSLMGPTFLSIDFFDSTNDIELPFDDPPFYLPSTTSVTKSLEQGVRTLTQELPAALTALGEKSDRLEGKLTMTLDAIATLAQNANNKLTDFDLAGLSKNLAGLVADSNALTKDTHKLVTDTGFKLSELNLAELQADARGLLRSASAAAQRLDSLLLATQHGEGPIGEIATATTSLESRTSHFFGTATENMQMADLPGTLLALRETLGSIDALVDFLERQPGSLIRGRAPQVSAPLSSER